ncbi:MAG: adenylyltransferase/cytidyltransferase family protein [Cyanobacteria bacterium P01_H01_bin.74]
MKVLSHRVNCYYFGTFNPIHSGHLQIASQTLKQFGKLFGFKKITFVPTAYPPHRKNNTNLIAPAHRYNLVELAIANNSAFQISSVEQSQHEKQGAELSLKISVKQADHKSCLYPNYTMESLLRLEKEALHRPQKENDNDNDFDHRVYCIAGTDALSSLSTWHLAEELAAWVHFIQAPRPGFPEIYTMQKTNQKSCVSLKTSVLDIPLFELSATWLRSQMKTCWQSSLPWAQLQTLQYYLPYHCLSYIYENHLYQK